VTNLEINAKIGELILSERGTTLEILHLINLSEERGLYLEFGYSNLYDWLIQAHKYSERAAGRRIRAAKLLKAVPEVADKLTDGSVNLSTLSKAQSMIRTQERVSGKKLSGPEKAEAVETIENQSEIKAEQALMCLFPDTASYVKQDRITVVNENTLRLGVNLSNEAVENLQRAKEILSHALPEGRAADVIAYVLEEFVRRKDPTKKNGAPPAQSVTRKQVIRAGEGRCSYRSPITGKVCGSRVRIERDHVRPRAMGGDDSPDNLRLLCRTHNQFMSERILGKEKATRWRRRKLPD
jgi:hypothetical protein